MGSKNKLKRFKENETFSNVIQPTRQEVFDDTLKLKGNWSKTFFKNEQPIVLELGCGKGEYSVNLAKMFPEKNFLGIDIKGARFWKGAKTSLEEKITNVGFLRTQIELVDLLFDENEIDEIWITFPDPQIKYKRTKHRMTNPEFLEKYKKILKPKGVIHLKTDSEYMHGYTLGLLQGLDLKIEYAHHDVYGTTNAPKEVTEIQTYYESQYLAIRKKITYLRFNFS
ncbi:tRNA (guanosine(46)-N7)-methyltransferase TrmB [Flavobacteriaceae bacterium]|nr:tRNA (guanosine(46)-N7)-methyltransferase TrmB [Flavobacteriaceae bacterium]MDB3866098.1 tRNA (guanosine(46)-N7)-methyltransferase TrmB [bacterium]